MSTPTTPLTPTQDAIRRLTTLTRLDKIVLGVLGLAAMAIAFVSLGAYLAGDDEQAVQATTTESATYTPVDETFAEPVYADPSHEIEFNPRRDIREQAVSYGILWDAMEQVSAHDMPGVCAEYRWDPISFTDQLTGVMLTEPELQGFEWHNINLMTSAVLDEFC